MVNLKKILYFLCFVCLITLSACSQTSQSEEKTVTDKNEKTDAIFDIDKKKVTLNSGYEMPLNGLGTYSLKDEICVQSVSSALASGVRLIDTAHAYDNEEAIGKAIKASRVPREDLFITTKLYPDQFSDPKAAIEEALDKLDVDYIDLLLLHHPGVDDVKAYKAMESYMEMGKI